MTDAQRQLVDQILAKNGLKPHRLTAILQEVQEFQESRYLPRDVLHHISCRMEVPPAQIYSTAAFYGSLSLQPKGTHRIRVCRGTTCHLEKSNLVEELFKRKLGIRKGDTTPDLTFSVESINCPGCCWTAALVVVNDTDYYEHVTPAGVLDILARYGKGRPVYHHRAESSYRPVAP